MNPDNIHQKSRGSEILGGLSILFEITGVALLLFGKWTFSLTLIATGILLSYIALKKAGGEKNPALYEDKDLFDLISYGVKCSQVKIGFHSTRDQSEVVRKLSNAGYKIKKGDVRNQIRRLIVSDKRAFSACRELIIIQTFVDLKETSCDGFGNQTGARFFLEAEVIFNTSDSEVPFKHALLSLINLNEDNQTIGQDNQTLNRTS